MAGNTTGKELALTTFGESHGEATGGILDGFPSRIPVDITYIQSEVNRRNPAGYPFSTSRSEPDRVEILSGLFEGMTTGTPIAFIIRNSDQKPGDYDALKNLYRPSHADYTYQAKYGIRDHRGGGRASARSTAAMVAGGAFAKIFLNTRGIRVTGYVSQIGPFRLADDLHAPRPETGYISPVNCPDPDLTIEMLAWLEEIRNAGDTAGGCVTCRIEGVPAGLGDPVFDRLHADLAKAVLAIPAARGFEIGSGFEAAGMTGSAHNDPFIQTPHGIATTTNHSGGIQGGISNGMEIIFRVPFKPVSSIAMKQMAVDSKGQPVSLEGKGRHDVCVVPRAVPIVEAMAALAVADHLIRKIFSKTPAQR